MKLRFKKVSAVALAGSLMACMFPTALANAQTSGASNMVTFVAGPLTNSASTQFVVRNMDGSSSNITLSETAKTRTVTVVDQTTGESNTFTFNKESGLLHSSITDLTVQLAASPQANGISTRSSKSRDSVYYFSWK